MAVSGDRMYYGGLHPLHAVLLAGTIPFFLATLLNDIAYASTYQIQWSNFASWLIVGGLIFAGLALLWAIVDLFRPDRRGRLAIVYVLVLVATWVLGFLNALHHARDAWGIMPLALVLSVVVAVLACAATWIGFTRLDAPPRPGDRR